MRAILLYLILSSATAPVGDSGTVSDPVFECHRVNAAWGFSMSGSAIGRDGSVVRYAVRDRDLRPSPLKVDNVTYYESSNLRAHFMGAKTSTAIDAGKVRENIALIDDAAKGTISTSATGVRDAGISSCHAYIFDAGNHRYRDVELGTDGGVSDMRIANDAKAASTLLDWLKTVGIALQ